MSPALHEFAPGEQVADRFDIIRRIGEGGMSVVYLAHDRQTHQVVALKVLKEEIIQRGYVHLLASEFSLISRLHHPALIEILDFFHPPGGAPFLVMEYVDGPELLTFLARMSLEEKARVLADVLRGLGYLHARGYVHLDLKPSNILVTREGRLKLTDFGLAGIFHRGMSVPMGTLLYLPPEVIQNAPVDHRADLYSLGLIFYRVFTGRFPFSARGVREVMQFHLEGTPTPPVMLGSLPVELSDLILRMLEKDPLKRPQSTFEVLKDLGRALRIHLPLETPESRESYLYPDRLVGREKEIQAFRKYLHHLVNELASVPVLWISGPKGSGKSRLLEEFWRISALKGVQFRILRADAADPLEPLREFLPTTVPREQIASLAHLLAERSQQQPMILAFDDLTQLPHTLQEFLRTLLEHRMMPHLGILLVVDQEAERSGRLPRFLEERLRHMPVERLELDFLTREEVGLLIESMLGDRLPQEVVNLLYERNGGSPYWIQETLRYLVDRGLLRREGAGWMLVEPSPQALEELLPSPDQLFAYRFGHLEETERRVLEVMALHRFPIALPTLRDVLDLPEDTLRSVMGSLQQKGWVEENRAQGEHYRLVQPPLRRLIQQTLGKRHRRALHRKLAVWYRKQQVDPRFEIWHLFAGGQKREARRVLEDWLEDKYAHQTLRSAEEFLEQLMGLEGAGDSWLLERLVELQFMQGRYESVVQRADQIAASSHPLPLLYLARSLVYLERTKEARGLLEQVRGRRLPRKARVQLRFLAFQLLEETLPTVRTLDPMERREDTLLRIWRGTHEGENFPRETVEQLLDGQDKLPLHLRLQSLLVGVQVALREGWLMLAERLLQELRSFLTHEMNLWGVMQLEWLSGEHAYRKGEWMTALAYLDRALRYAERLHLSRSRRFLLSRMAHLYWRMGDWSRARKSLLRAGLIAESQLGEVPLALLEIPEPLMPRDPLPERFQLLRTVREHMENSEEEARQMLQEAMHQGVFSAFPVLEPDLLYLFGTLYPHAREEVWERALDLAEHRGDRWLAAVLNLSMAELYAPHDRRMAMNLLHRSLEHMLEMHRLTLPEDRDALRKSSPLQALQGKIQGLFQHLLDFRDPRSLEFFQRILGRVPASSTLSHVGEGTADLLTTTMMDEASIQSLIRLTLVMSNVMDREEDLSLLLDVILEHLHADRGVLLWKESDGEWRTMARLDRTKGAHRDVEPIQELVEEMERTENPVLVEDVLLHPWKKEIPHTDAHTLFCLPLKRKGNLVGLLYAEADKPMYRSRSLWSPFLDLMLRNLTLAVENVRLTAKLQESFKVALRVLVSSLEARDAYTIGHSENVRELCIRLGERLGLSRKELDTLEIAAILHDVGKIGIPDNILLKKGQLTPEEFERVKEHTLIGERIVAQIPGMQEVARMIRSHHERWDGSGYPDGLSGEAIPFLARVIAVCDVYDALVSLRPYREALANEDALRIMERESGRHFDPGILEAFLNLMREEQEMGYAIYRRRGLAMGR